MKKKDAQPISNVMELYFHENPLAARKLAEVRLINSWEKVLGAMVMRYTSDIFIKNMCLYVKINSSVVKNELMTCRDKLIHNLNQEAGAQVITAISFI
ncbi:MAG: DUF721 domain-containing protein [Dysgonamonadaceae bacterium]|jgi:hypothetical protein|nr:DUF721 domain-containing protein [Dysgonamonadaceae bacterium]